MRTKLSDWIDRSLGQIHSGDFFHISEEVGKDKANNEVRHIILELKKEQGWQKTWASEETIAEWEKQIKEIIGDNILKLEIKSSEATEGRYLGGLTAQKKFEEIRGKAFQYRFHLEIIKKEERK